MKGFDLELMVIQAQYRLMHSIVRDVSRHKKEIRNAFLRFRIKNLDLRQFSIWPIPGPDLSDLRIADLMITTRSSSKSTEYVITLDKPRDTSQSGVWHFSLKAE